MVDDAEFKVEEVLPGRGELGVNRTLIDRHGMRVVVVQEGTSSPVHVCGHVLTLVVAAQVEWARFRFRHC